MAMVCSEPLKLTFYEQESLIIAFTFHLFMLPCRSRYQEIKRYRKQLRCDHVPWYSAEAADCNVDSLQKCMRRLQPHRYCCLDDDIRLGFRTFASISPELCNSLEERDGLSSSNLADCRRTWSASCIGDAWILTSILFKRWPAELRSDCEPIKTWLGILERELRSKARQIGANIEKPWELALHMVRNHEFIDDAEPIKGPANYSRTPKKVI